MRLATAVRGIPPFDARQPNPRGAIAGSPADGPNGEDRPRTIVGYARLIIVRRCAKTEFVDECRTIMLQTEKKSIGPALTVIP